MSNTDQPHLSRAPVFVTTRWTLVMRARGDAPEARAALGDLCEAYWSPVFRFLLREGRTEEQARELSQEFFSRLLSRGGIDNVEPGHGRFRSYLLGAVKHFLADLKRSAGRQKRGGNIVMESIESSGASGTSPGIQLHDPSATIPDTYFDQQWALVVMKHALAAVESEFKTAGKGKQFEALKPWLVGDSDKLSQSEVATELNMTAGAVKVAIHRMRKSFRNAVQFEIEQTVNTPSEIEVELRYLIEVMSG